MELRTTARDCLYLNWAVAADRLPPLPEPLRYQLCSGRDPSGAETALAFASLLLFHQEGLRLTKVPVSIPTYPQLHLRLYVLAPDGTPAVLFRRVLVPPWIAPAVRLLARHPAESAHLTFPHPSHDPEAGRWSWRVEGDEPFAVTAERAAPSSAATASEWGSWRETVRFFRQRPRAYAEAGGRLRTIETEQPETPVWPMKAEIEDDRLVRAGLFGDLDAAGDPEDAEDAPLPPLHSAWLCPEMPLVFELGGAEAGARAVRHGSDEVPVGGRVPAV